MWGFMNPPLFTELWVIHESATSCRYAGGHETLLFFGVTATSALGPGAVCHWTRTESDYDVFEDRTTDRDTLLPMMQRFEREA
jgi:hypothetical protein